LLAGAGIRNPAALALKSGEQLPALAQEIWGSGLAAGHLDWFSIESSSRDVAGFQLVFDESVKMLDGLPFLRSPQPSFVLPETDSAGLTRVHLLNPKPDNPVLVSMRLMSESGTSKALWIGTVAASGSLHFPISELFPQATFAETDYILVAGGSDLIALQSLQQGGQWFRALAGQDMAGSSTILYSPQCAVGGGWSTTLSIVNREGTPGTLTLTLYNEDGSQSGESKVLPIAALGKVTVDAASFGMRPDGELFRGYVEIRSSGPRVSGSVTFGDSNGVLFSSSLPLQAANSAEFVLAHVASSSAWYTGVALLNPNDADVTAHLQLRDRTGSVLAERNETIAGRRRISRLLTEQFPELSGRDIVSGYLRISADQPVIVLGVFGTTDLSALSAIAPLPAR
jgi:hypothetical protein